MKKKIIASGPDGQENMLNCLYGFHSTTEPLHSPNLVLIPIFKDSVLGRRSVFTLGIMIQLLIT